MTKQKSFNEIVNELSSKLTEEELWDVMTALRGPDNCNYILKQAITARIRYLIGMRGDNRGRAITKRTPLGKPTVNNVLKKLTNIDRPHHFLKHVANAINVLYRHELITYNEKNNFHKLIYEL